MLGSRPSTCNTNVCLFPPTPFCYFCPIWIPALPIHSHICSQTWYQHRLNHIPSIYWAGSVGLCRSQDKLTPSLHWHQLAHLSWHVAAGVWVGSRSMGLSAHRVCWAQLLPKQPGWYTLTTRGLEGQQHLGLCEQELSQQTKQVHLLSSTSQTPPGSVTQFQTPPNCPVLNLWGEAEQLGLAQPGEEILEKVLGRPWKQSHSKYEAGIKKKEPGLLQWCVVGRWKGMSVSWTRVVQRGILFSLWGQPSSETGFHRGCWVCILKGFQNLTEQSNLVWSQSLPCFEQEVGVETSWGPFTPQLSYKSMLFMSENICLLLVFKFITLWMDHSKISTLCQ